MANACCILVHCDSSASMRGVHAACDSVCAHDFLPSSPSRSFNYRIDDNKNNEEKKMRALVTPLRER